MALTENVNYIIDAAFPIVESGLTFEHEDGNQYEIILPKNEAPELQHDTNVKGVNQKIEERLNLFYKEVEKIITVGNRESIIDLKVELQTAISHYEKVYFDNYTLMTLIKGIDEKIKAGNLFIENPVLYQKLIKDRGKYVPYYRRLRWAKIFSDRIKEVCEKIDEVLLPPPAEAAPVVEVKAKTGRNKDPYNAKIKAKFFDVVIENDATIMGKKIYQNNEEKFAAYANTMHESFGMVVEPGTLENNWNKNLNEPEKKLLRELLITHNYRNLAVTIAVTM